MMKNYILLLMVSFIGVVFQAQTTFTEWNFDDQTTNPISGSGTITLIGGTTSTFAGGNPSTGKGFNTSTYPAQSTLSGTAGVEFAVSTVGKTNIAITFDQRGSGTSSRWAQFEYSTNGSDWVVFGNNNGGLSPHDTFYTFTVNLTTCTECNNNANFKFRIVSIFSPVSFNTQGSSEVFGANEAYHRSREDGTNTSAYATSGTWRFDNVKFIENYVAGTNDYSLNTFKMYPNPSNTIINFSEAINVEIFDVFGKEIFTQENATQIDISNFAKGIYVVTNDKGYSEKLIIE